MSPAAAQPNFDILPQSAFPAPAQAECFCNICKKYTKDEVIILRIFFGNLFALLPIFVV